jgi:DNA-binding transcriptional regulator YbjK
VVRDKEDLGYKGMISDFEKEIGRAQLVIVAISDKYLRSEDCMYELYELYRNSKLEKEELLEKIFPVRVESINLKDPEVRKSYYDHWKKLEMVTKELVNEYGEDQTKHRRVESIKLALRDLLPFLNDINSLNTEMHSNDNFAEIKKAIKGRIEASLLK